MRTQTNGQELQAEGIFPETMEVPGLGGVQTAIGIDFSSLELPAEAAENCGPQPNRDELIVQHLPTVRFVARRVYERLPQHVDLEDLISAGIVGLIDAAGKFDWSKQVQFKSYAQFRIRGAILDSLRTLDWSPRELRRKGRAMAEAIHALSSRFGRTPTDAEIAVEMGMDLQGFQIMTGELKGLELGSLNLERTDDFDDEELDYVAAPVSADPLLQCIEGQTREQLAAGIEALPEKERLVLTLYYFEELTMKEIGLTLGVVESRVSQIRTSAVARLGTLLGQRRHTQTSSAKRRMN